jgi:excisionase family DNA binding protein
MDTNATPTPAVETDLRLVTVAEAAEFLAVSRGALYALLGSGQLASVHIGRARRIPMAELKRFVRERLSA